MAIDSPVEHQLPLFTYRRANVKQWPNKEAETIVGNDRE
jgi:hypothetical protein